MDNCKTKLELDDSVQNVHISKRERETISAPFNTLTSTNKHISMGSDDCERKRRSEALLCINDLGNNKHTTFYMYSECNANIHKDTHTHTAREIFPYCSWVLLFALQC